MKITTIFEISITNASLSFKNTFRVTEPDELYLGMLPLTSFTYEGAAFMTKLWL